MSTLLAKYLKYVTERISYSVPGSQGRYEMEQLQYHLRRAKEYENKLKAMRGK